MSYPFVASYFRYGSARGPRLAVVWHMAEGYSTVAYLSKQNPNGVSVHFVIDRYGKITQMLRLDEMHGSINASDIRTTDDTDGFFGRTAAKAVMGAWADTKTTLGPNHASIGVEIEGFAVTGPNIAQRGSMHELWLYLQDKYPSIRSLGHRDFQDYKRCPGKLIPWSLVGGHGPVSAEDNMAIQAAPGLTSDRLIDLPANAEVFFDPNLTRLMRQMDGPETVPYVGAAIGESVAGGSRAVVIRSAAPYGGGEAQETVGYIRTALASPYAKPVPSPEPVTYPVTLESLVVNVGGQGVAIEPAFMGSVELP